MPKVSIIVPNYNYARFLDQRIGSIEAQTYRDFEVILLDDASTDESAEVLQQFASRAARGVMKTALQSIGCRLRGCGDACAVFAHQVGYWQQVFFQWCFCRTASFETRFAKSDSVQA